MAVARPSEVVAVNAVRADGTERSGTHDSAVGIVMGAGLIKTGMKTDLRRVALPKEVLWQQLKFEKPSQQKR